MTSKILSIILLLVVFTGPIYAQHEGHQMPTQSKQKTQEKVKGTTSSKPVYYCPMHPTYISHNPGECPICNMKLVKKGESQAVDTGVQELKDEGFYISQEKQQLIGVSTEKVIYRPLNKIIRTVGRVAFDPELYRAQQEYIEALKTLENVIASGQEGVIRRAEALVEAAKLRLMLQGLDITQIEELQRTKKNDPSLLISFSDSDFTWVYATIYEYELEWVRLAQEAIVSTSAYPGKEFKGKVVAIDPVFDAMTRSVRARIKVDHQDSVLKPDMYVDVQISSDLGAHLAVSKEAIMDSGVRKIVFLELDSGRFKPLEIKTGFSTDEYAQVIDGLKEGDTVVVSGNFLIDSESKLKSALEGAGHRHSP